MKSDCDPVIRRGSRWFAGVHNGLHGVRNDSPWSQLFAGFKADWHVSTELDRIEELELLILMPSERLRQLSIFSLL